MPSAADVAWMRRALVLAERGVGLVSPNPAVGCVLVNAQSEVVGAGFHQYALRDHAEVVALREAGTRAHGATAYVTLEPCTHQGRTGPCADALMAAGVARVVIATVDANPVVRGHGIAKLQAAGIAVEVGAMQAEAQRLNDAFAKLIRTGSAWVTLKVALSRDGFIAPAAAGRKEKSPFWLTGPEALAEVQRLRHAHDAILTGIGTVLADDPLLTDRSGLPRRRPLLRVVLDTHLRIPLDAKLLATCGEDVVIFSGSDDTERIAAVQASGARVMRLPAASRVDAFSYVLGYLSGLKNTSVLIEGGTGMNTTAVEGKFVDRYIEFRAAVEVGAGGIAPVSSPYTLPMPATDGIDQCGEDDCRISTLRSYWDE